MNVHEAFIDYYKVLDVRPDCDSRELESAYRHLAKMYHPDHTDQDDATKFTDVVSAYRVLRNPERRAAYDAIHTERTRKGSSADETKIDIGTALDDADAHEKILLFLYHRRRQHAEEPGVFAYYLQEMLGCSYEHFEFHKWYLKEKGLLSITEQGTLGITVQGVDHVISLSRTTRAESLRLAQPSVSSD